jgi:hypothetical protein
MMTPPLSISANPVFSSNVPTFIVSSSTFRSRVLEDGKRVLCLEWTAFSTGHPQGHFLKGTRGLDEQIRDSEDNQPVSSQNDSGRLSMKLNQECARIAMLGNGISEDVSPIIAATCGFGGDVR